MRFGGTSKRIIAMIIVAFMVLTYAPSLYGVVRVDAAGNGALYAPTATISDAFLPDPNQNSDSRDEMDQAAEEPEVEPYHITQNSEAEPAYSSDLTTKEWASRESVLAPDRTYALTVCTGATKGDTVLYFGIKYKDDNGISRTHFVFPHVDGFKRGNDLLNHELSGRKIDDTFGKKLAASFNYKEAAESEQVLPAWSVQDFAFQTEASIKTVESIDIFLESGTWNCKGIAIYHVDSYKGLEEYGMISGQRFLDFEGYLIADAMKKGSENLSGGGQDEVYSIGGKHDSGKFEFTTYSDDTHTKGYAVQNSVHTFRMDFADTFDGGLESFINYDATPLSGDMGIVEDIAIEVQYKDIHGWTRKVTLPVLLNSYAQARYIDKNKRILGLGQRGDTLAFYGILPEFVSLVGEPVIYVGDLARSEIKKVGGLEPSTPSAKMNKVLTASQKDDISITGFSIYDGGCIPYTIGGTDSDGKKVEGATVFYKFESGTGPKQYYTTTQESGRLIMSGGKDAISLSVYQQGAPVLGVNPGNNKFLVTLNTSTLEGAGSDSDISLRFYYKTLEGSVSNTPLYKVKESANEFLGKWPTVSGDDFVENSGLVSGGKISFLIDAENLMDFAGIELNLGSDSWTMHNLSISYMESYNGRMAYVTPVSLGGATSNFWIERSSISADIFTLKGTTAIVTDDEGNTLDVNGEKKKEVRYKKDKDGNIMLDDNDKPILEEVPENERDENDKKVVISKDITFKKDSTYKIEFDADSEIDIRKTKYSEVRYVMTHDQTQINWGFFKKRRTYNVGVEVAKDSDFDTGNGDSGSKNHFYFQLIFKNGNSGYVLANQQITSDGFRAGQTETFTIFTNQDYGVLKSIRIIPEDVSSDADPFDKLNIKSVTVSEQSTGGSYISYVIDQIGWIDIDYRDELESITPHGQRARTANELSKDYKVAYKQKNVKLVCEISSEPWTGDFDQFIGSMKADVKYITESTGEEKTMTIDVCQCMAQYMEVDVASVETNPNPDIKLVKEDGLGTVSNSKWMFRKNHVDRMMLPPIPDLARLKSISFKGQNLGANAATWRIKNISVLQVIEDGAVQLTTNNEKYRNIKYRKVCVGNNEDIVEEKFIIGGTGSLGPIEFSPNEIIWNEGDEWATPIARLPDSTDDRINVFVYPEVGEKNTNKAKVNMSFKYNIPFSQYKTIAQADLSAQFDAKGRSMYMAKDLSAPDFISPNDFTVYCVSTMRFDYAVVQHVREGTIIGSYIFDLTGATATRGAKGYISNGTDIIDFTEERISVGFDAGSKEKTLSPEKMDVAISFDYKSSLDGATYHSPYKYITDMGYTKTYEGLCAEVDFDVKYVAEILGYNIAGYGTLEANIADATGIVYETKQEMDPLTGDMSVIERKRRNYASFKDNYALTDRISFHKKTKDSPYGEDAVALVALKFDTSASTATKDGASKSSVRMKFHYNDFKKTEKPNVEFEDITKYIQGDTRQFISGETQVVKVFLRDMNEKKIIKSVDILPYNAEVVIENKEAQVPDDVDDKSIEQTLADTTGDGEEADTTKKESDELAKQIIESRAAYWTISNATCDIGYGDMVTDRNGLNQTFDGLDNGGVLRIVDVTLRTTVQKNKEKEETVKDHLHTLYAEKGDEIKGKVTIGKAEANNFKVVAYEMIGEAPKDVTKDTITLSDKFYFTFTAPENKKKDDVEYKIEVSPEDAPDIIDTILVSVIGTDEELKLKTTVSRNKEEGKVVTDGLIQLWAEKGDDINGTVVLEGSDKGFDAKVYHVSDNKEVEVTKECLSVQEKYYFSFKIPTETTEKVAMYKLVVSAADDPNVKDIIMVNVVENLDDTENATSSDATEKKDTDTDKEKSSEQKKEETTEKTTEETTEKTTEETTEEKDSDKSTDKKDKSDDKKKDSEETTEKKDDTATLTDATSVDSGLEGFEDR